MTQKENQPLAFIFENVSNHPCHTAGANRAARKIASQLTILDASEFEASCFKDIIELLLRDRKNTQPTPAQITALTLLYDWTMSLASFGLSPSLFNFPHELRLPRVPSIVLTDKGYDLITNPQILEEIEKRREMKQMRGGQPPENGLTLCLAPEKLVKEIEAKYAINARFPAAIVVESYTRTSPKEPIIEFDMKAGFILWQEPDDSIKAFFLEEVRLPHLHYYKGGGQWERIDEGEPGFKLPEEVVTPETRKGPREASNEEIATLLILFREAVKNPIE